MNKLLDVGPLELVVLGCLNIDASKSVLDVQNELKKSGHDLAYTTVLTVLTRLYKKNRVHRKKCGRQFLYTLSTRKELSTFKIFEKIKNSLFRTEKMRPILGLLENDQHLSKEELEALKLLIEQKLREKT